ncbi:Mu transposase C-terminal domain-containing protein [Bacillus sp. D386]|uniref:Mu transposase C-terminal domain-containing protein n=1 Tax=Bacillus sp. D386 TaxID=2587155 RepID=UPI00111E68CD|nr:Mu transposase C-terminal domain-containing protein [Bacillus sp. D386]
MGEIEVGGLVAYEKVIYRILWISERKDIAYWINVYSTKNIPDLISYNYLNQLLSDNQIEIKKEDKVFNIDALMSVSEKEQSEITTRWKHIRDIVMPENEPFIYSDIQFRRRLVIDAAEKNNCDITTIYRTLGKYWRGGKKLVGLSSSYGILKERKKRTYTNKPGPKTSNKVIVDERMEQIFEKAINKYYLASPYTSIRSAYDEMIREFFATKIIDLTGEPKLIYVNGDERPTYNQFKYYLKKKLGDPKYYRKKVGSREYNLKHRELTGDVFKYAKYPGNTYEIDSTIFDIYLVSEWNPKKIVGRPILFLVVDVFSRSIVGFNVGLERPSWNIARLAIVNAIENKVTYCKRFGINISKQDWPMNVIPTEIVGDRGEMISKNSSLITKTLGSTVKNTRSYRGDDKPIVENTLGVIRRTLIDFLPGGVRKDFNKRGGEDYRLKALLTLSDFRKIIIKTILYLNNSRVLANYKLSKKMIENNLEPIPKDIWNFGVKNINEGMGKMSSELVSIQLLPEDQASITRSGILFQKRTYISDEIINDGLLKTAGINGTEKIKIKYDPRDLSVIYYFDQRKHRFYICMSKDEKYILMEQCDLLTLTEKNDEKTRNSLYKKDEEKNNLIQYIKDISEEKREKSRNTQQTESKTNRIKNIEANRRQEIEYMRNKDIAAIDKKAQDSDRRRDQVYNNWRIETHKDIQAILEREDKD